ncbi:hypothetical protein ES703_61016 [subsurface metagenome]
MLEVLSLKRDDDRAAGKLAIPRLAPAGFLYPS